MTAPAVPNHRHWLTFQLDGQAYAAPLVQVSEVIRVGEVTPVPGAASDLLGVRHLRGRVVPVLDGRRRLGLPPRDGEDDGVRVVMLSHAAHLVGLRVDGVGELLLPGNESVAPPPPGRATREDDPVTGVLPWKGGFVALLDVRRLCRLPESGAA
ncbi:chemotaxis protein CheW [Frateuria terrea]|uniref:Purine-binding chemotaxis protein CheW n=1 Tax=Frateuria terrea TaxID=529704 RepID=A0A1H6VW82_9GAMM|nr:chemotaxis protein CheW [Frateuria terrea]SEJ08921.1 purine-binding chemotaxis protein CheW [Frateuria terrea]SFP68700.1 purine-binding chemotaxis protein CheW [Frateuria terrea]